MFAQLDYYPKTTVILEDNRANDNRPLSEDSVQSFELKPIVWVNIALRQSENFLMFLKKSDVLY